jgi:hypothetical protein
MGPFKFVSKPYVLALTPVKIPEGQRQLVAWWKFDEAEGSIVGDSSGNNFAGTLIGNPQWQPAGGKIGGALAFDGVDDYIDCGSHPSLNFTEGVSVAAWIKLAGPAKDQKIVSNQGYVSGYKVSIYDNKVELEIRGGSFAINRGVEGGTVLEPGTWYHIVGTYRQGGSIKTYVNAKLDRELETTIILAPSTGTLKMGRESIDSLSDLYWFNGLMDDLRIYNYPLSQAEIMALYSGEILPTTTQTEVPATVEEEPGTGSNWIPVLVIMIIAAAAAGLANRRKKASA